MNNDTDQFANNLYRFNIHTKKGHITLFSPKLEDELGAPAYQTIDWFGNTIDSSVTFRKSVVSKGFEILHKQLTNKLNIGEFDKLVDELQNA
jgi:uncharacterized protein with ATP-grasp and redox domains